MSLFLRALTASSLGLSLVLSTSAFAGSVIKIDSKHLPKSLATFSSQLQDRISGLYSDRFVKPRFQAHMTLLFLDGADNLENVLNEDQTSLPTETKVAKLHTIITSEAAKLAPINLSENLAGGELILWNGTAPAHVRKGMGLPEAGDYTIVAYKLTPVRELESLVASLKAGLSSEKLLRTSKNPMTGLTSPMVDQPFALHLTIGYISAKNTDVELAPLASAGKELAEMYFSEPVMINQISLDAPTLTDQIHAVNHNHGVYSLTPAAP